MLIYRFAMGRKIALRALPLLYQHDGYIALGALSELLRSRSDEICGIAGS